MDMSSESLKSLSDLKSYSTIFSNKILTSIAIKTDKIHELLTETDPSKLNLFHTQFTVTLVDLLDKVSKNIKMKEKYEELESTVKMPDFIADSVSKFMNHNYRYARGEEKSPVDVALIIPEDTNNIEFTDELFLKPRENDCYINLGSSTVHSKVLSMGVLSDFKVTCLGIKNRRAYFEYTNKNVYFYYDPKKSLFELMDTKVNVIGEREVKRSTHRNLTELNPILSDYLERINHEYINFLNEDITTEYNVLNAMIKYDRSQVRDL